MSGLRSRWLGIKRGWRIAIASILGLTLLLGGAWLYFYQRTALAREFDRMLMGVALMANAPGQNGLTDDQIRQIIIPLRNLEIQDTITPDAARKTIADIRAALTPEQLKAIDQAKGATTGRFVSFGGVPGGSGTGDNASPGTQFGGRPRARLLSGLRGRRGAGPIARLIAPLLTKLPQPAMVSQVCQRLEDRLNGVTPATSLPDGTIPK